MAKMLKIICLDLSGLLILLYSTCFQLIESTFYQVFSVCVVCELQVYYQLNALSSLSCLRCIPFLVFPFY